MVENHASKEHEHEPPPLFGSMRRVVIKVGSSLVCDGSGEAHKDFLENFCAGIASLRNKNYEVAIVSSGAIALGSSLYGLDKSSMTLEEQQAAAAVGQIRLMRTWREALEVHDVTCAQMLLTWHDMQERLLEARETLRHLWRAKIVPIINENDSLATDEIRFGDNDRLAASVAGLAMADALLLLSDVDGLYDHDPRQKEDASHIAVVRGGIDDDIHGMAGAAAGFGSGGMVTKLQAAEMAMKAGCHMIIMNGHEGQPLARLQAGEGRMTWFIPDENPKQARRRWLESIEATNNGTNGTIEIADETLLRLKQDATEMMDVEAVDILVVGGTFGRGDMVSIVCKNEEVGRGLIAWGADELRRLAGHKKSDFKAILGYHSGRAVVRGDDIWLKKDMP